MEPQTAAGGLGSCLEIEIRRKEDNVEVEMVVEASAWTHNSFKGSVDTPHTGVNTMFQALSQKMKKWSSSVDTRSNGVDTRDLSQKACFAVLSSVSTRDEVVSTLEISPREVFLPVWDSVSTLDQCVDTKPDGVDTRDLSQKAYFAVLSSVSTRDEVVSTLEISPREVFLPVWDSVSTPDQVRSTHSKKFVT
ncbi:hypothetical protein Taro_046908 [Colocasia esculenta]|uniref:Uncharacterized protein n=1 Tax=Colocasia esculenta TaxID=4460 RepID=A0A843X4R8_COLES|nr:hypothetical protein [Colocasia esculenta]